jgi:hypothetical protein
MEPLQSCPRDQDHSLRSSCLVGLGPLLLDLILHRFITRLPTCGRIVSRKSMGSQKVSLLNQQVRFVLHYQRGLGPLKFHHDLLLLTTIP